MSVGLFIILGLLAWTVLPLPLAVVIGRALGGVELPADVPEAQRVTKNLPVPV